jgi:hypothetical protein
LKEFGLNLKGKDCLKKSLKKRKEKEKKKAYLLTFSARRPSGPSIPSRSGPSSSSCSFSPRALTSGPRLSASPLPFPFFFLSPLLSRPGAAAILVAPGRPSTFPSSLRGQLRQLISRDQLDPLPPFLKPKL